MQKIVARPINDSEWDAFVNAHVESTPFHTSWWMQLLERVYGLASEKVAFYIGNELVAVIPIQRGKKAGLQLSGSPFPSVATPVQGPLIQIDDRQAVWSAITEHLRKRGDDYFEFACPTLAGSEVLSNLGYCLEERQTLVMRLDRLEEDVLSGFEKGCRWSVRKAQRSGVTVLAETSPEEWADRYYPMVTSVYARQGRTPPIPKAFYQHLARAPVQNVRMLFALYEGRAIAGGLFLVHRDRAYYLDGASFDEHRSICPNHLIQHEFIKWARGQGIRDYDMVGANVPSIAAFKSSFGAELTPYLYAFRENSVSARVGRAAYRKLAPVVRRLGYSLRRVGATS